MQEGSIIHPGLNFRRNTLLEVLVCGCHVVQDAEQMHHTSGGPVFCENFAFGGVTL